MLRQEEPVPDFRILRQVYTGRQEEDAERFHSYHEFFYVSEGCCSVFIGQRAYRLTSGHFAMIPAGALHKTDFLSLGQSVKYVLSFSKETARRIDAFLGEPLTGKCLKPGRVTAPVQRRDAVLLLLNRMHYEYENQPLHAQSFCHACLAELLISILRYRTHEEENDGTVDAHADRIQAVADYISAHFSEDLSLSGLAGRFAVSPSYLSRSFKAATGFGIREYLISIRIQRACDLLMNTRLSITEIADRCGFSDSNYFGDAFRKATGISPREFRRIG